MNASLIPVELGMVVRFNFDVISELAVVLRVDAELSKVGVVESEVLKRKAVVRGTIRGNARMGTRSIIIGE